MIFCSSSSGFYYPTSKIEKKKRSYLKLLASMFQNISIRNFLPIWSFVSSFTLRKGNHAQKKSWNEVMLFIRQKKSFFFNSAIHSIWVLSRPHTYVDWCHLNSARTEEYYIWYIVTMWNFSLYWRFWMQLKERIFDILP